MRPDDVPYNLHDVMLEHCQQCNQFKKKWKIVNNSLEPVVHKSSSHDTYVSQFLRGTPTPEDWSRKQLEIVKNSDTYHKTLSSLFVGDSAPGSTQAQYPNNLVAIGKQFAELTVSSSQSRKLQRSFSYFQAFILLLYCAVLERIGTDRREVDSILETVSTFGTKRKTTLRRSAWKAYKVIGRLVKVGWTISRATELFFLSKFVDYSK
jgi:hypothetical protein